MAFSILATPQTPNCLGSASEFHYEKTVISHADKCGHYTVITFHHNSTHTTSTRGMLAIISMARHMSISHHLNAMKQDLAVCVGSRPRAEGLNAAMTRSPLTLTLNGSCSQFGCSKEACLQYQFIRIFMSLHPTIFVRPGFCKYCASKLISAAKKWNRQKM